MAEARQTGEIAARECLQPRRGLRTLEGQQHTIALAIAHGDPPGLELLADPGGVRLGTGGVDHHHQLVTLVSSRDNAAPVVDDQVVADAAGLVEQHGVAGLARSDPEQIARHQGLQGVLDAVAAQGEHPHVGDVEDTAVLAHGLVLLDQAAELHRHLPASEGHHAAAGDPGRLKQGGAGQDGVGRVRGGGGAGHGGLGTGLGGILWRAVAQRCAEAGGTVLLKESGETL